MSDIPGDASTTVDLPMDTLVTSTIDQNGDTDWFRVNLTAGVRYDILQVGEGAVGGNVYDGLLYIRDSNGNLLAFGDDEGPGLDAFANDFLATYTGTYYVEFRGIGEYSTGPYSLLETTRSVVVNRAGGTTGPDYIIGSIRGETLTGLGGADTVYGFDGNDLLIDSDSAGIDRLYGGNGDDTIVVDFVLSNEVFDGGNDYDTIDLSAESYAFNFTLGDFSQLLATFRSFEGAIGGMANDTIRGSAGDNGIGGGGGNDSLSGFGGNDALTGGTGADALDGGDGLDTASYASSGSRVGVNLTTGLGVLADAQGDVLTGIENLVGSAYDDILWGSAGGNRLEGGAGADNLVGYAGADTLDGGAGSDLANYRESGGRVLVNLTSGFGFFGDANGDVLISIERVIGSGFDDTLVGGAEDNRFQGGGGSDYLDASDGADLLYGEAGDDFLAGGAGADRLAGGVGNDELRGGAGADQLTGGAGADTFYWRGSDESSLSVRDRVLDFNAAEGDRLDLSTFDAEWAGTGPFLGNGVHSLNYRVLSSGRDIYLQGDEDGDGRTDFVVQIMNVTSLSESDLIL